jgi:hypothetical protein
MARDIGLTRSQSSSGFAVVETLSRPRELLFEMLSSTHWLRIDGADGEHLDALWT